MVARTRFNFTLYYLCCWEIIRIYFRVHTEYKSQLFSVYQNFNSHPAFIQDSNTKFHLNPLYRFGGKIAERGQLPDYTKMERVNKGLVISAEILLLSTLGSYSNEQSSDVNPKFYGVGISTFYPTNQMRWNRHTVPCPRLCTTLEICA